MIDNKTIDVLVAYNQLYEEYEQLEQQLKAKQDKEDKLREVLKKHTPVNEDIILYEIKQILNEGSDE